MRLIDADALIENIQWAETIEDAIKEILAAPTIEAEPVKTGRWIEDDDLTLPSHCSVCGEYALEWVETRYCPNCGAKMEGAEQ